MFCHIEAQDLFACAKKQLVNIGPSLYRFCAISESFMFYLVTSADSKAIFSVSPSPSKHHNALEQAYTKEVEEYAPRLISNIQHVFHVLARVTVCTEMCC